MGVPLLTLGEELPFLTITKSVRKVEGNQTFEFLFSEPEEQYT